jgi:hypothetical protein
MDVTGSQSAPLDITELIEHEQRVIAGAAEMPSSGVFIPSCARSRLLPDVQNGARIAIHRPETACHLLTTRGPSCTMDRGSSKIEEGLQAHCKNQPSVHGQLAGISKLNPRRLGDPFYKSEVRSDLASAERAGSAGTPNTTAPPTKRARASSPSRSRLRLPAARFCK